MTYSACVTTGSPYESCVQMFFIKISQNVLRCGALVLYSTIFDNLPHPFPHPSTHVYMILVLYRRVWRVGEGERWGGVGEIVN